MKTDLTMTNESFSFLRGSSDFLNMILNNITSCVLLLDKNLKLRAFNDPLRTIFSNKQDEHLLFKKCGEAIGCAYQIEEEAECGQTSHCTTCDLKIAALNSYVNNVPIYKTPVTKPFFDRNNKKINKHLQFSTRLFIFKKEKYIVMIIEDITNLIDPEKET